MLSLKKHLFWWFIKPPLQFVDFTHETLTPTSSHCLSGLRWLKFTTAEDDNHKSLAADQLRMSHEYGTWRSAGEPPRFVLMLSGIHHRTSPRGKRAPGCLWQICLNPCETINAGSCELRALSCWRGEVEWSHAAEVPSEKINKRVKTVD